MTFAAAPIQFANKAELYAGLAEQARGLLHGERNLIANAANFAALVWHALPDLNWCGFYPVSYTHLTLPTNREV